MIPKEELDAQVEAFYVEEANRGRHSWSPGMTASRPLIEALHREVKRLRGEKVKPT
jgi:hypothetical protein